MGLIMTVCQSGDEIVAANNLYGGTIGSLSGTMVAMGFKSHFVDPKDLNALEEIPSYEEVVDDSILKSCGADDFDTFIKEKVDPVFPQGMDYETWKEKALSIKE